MPEDESQTTHFDWRLTSFEGARREQLRRWAQLPLEDILLAIEEMEDVARQLGAVPAGEYRTEPAEGILSSFPLPTEGEGQGEGDPKRGSE